MAGAQASDPFTSAVRALLMPRGETGDRPVEQAALARIYSPSDSRPVWSRRDGHLTVQASAAIDALASAESHGLVSEDYDVTALWELAFTAEVSRADAARFDVALTRAMTRFLADLRFGRIEPAAVRFDLPNVEDPIELATLVTAVARAADVQAAVAGATPAYAGYQALERALARYRALARDTTLRAPERVATTIRCTTARSSPPSPSFSGAMDSTPTVSSVPSPCTSCACHSRSGSDRSSSRSSGGDGSRGRRRAATPW
jgi:murein L,D-transpeptidase YcbB/YkuD